MRLFLFFLLTLYPSFAFAQGRDVLVVYANDTPSEMVPLLDDLTNSGRFGSVDSFNAMQATPSASFLQGYDAVLIISWNWYLDATATGDNLADFVDQGGNVLVMAFANINWASGGYLRGRWETGNYNVIQPGGTYATGQANLGTVFEPSHSIMQGVTSFDGGSWSWRSPSSTLSSNGRRIADWSDGRILVAVDESYLGGRADLNFYPVDETIDSGFWNSTTDGYLLIENALDYVISGGLPDLRIVNPAAGELMTIEVRSVTAGANVVTMLSSLGSGPTPSVFGEIAVSLPWRQTPPFPADGNGVMSFSTYLPLGASGHTIYCQSVALDSSGGGELSNPVEISVQ